MPRCARRKDRGSAGKDSGCGRRKAAGALRYRPSSRRPRRPLYRRIGLRQGALDRFGDEPAIVIRRDTALTIGFASVLIGRAPAQSTSRYNFTWCRAAWPMEKLSRVQRLLRSGSVRTPAIASTRGDTRDGCGRAWLIPDPPYVAVIRRKRVIIGTHIETWTGQGLPSHQETSPQ